MAGGGALDLVGHFGVGVAFLEGVSFCHGCFWLLADRGCSILLDCVLGCP